MHQPVIAAFVSELCFYYHSNHLPLILQYFSLRELESYNFQKEELRKEENEKLTLATASLEQAFSFPSLL